MNYEKYHPNDFQAFFCACKPDITKIFKSPLAPQDLSGSHGLLVKELLPYLLGSKRYLVSQEQTEYSHQESDGYHYHFVAEMTASAYHSFCKHVFKDGLKLNGRAIKNGLPRQYGKINIIRDFQKLIAYTLKDNNIKTNFSTTLLKKCQEISFPKDEEKTFMYSAQASLSQMDLNESYIHNGTLDLYKWILNHYVNANNSIPTKTKIDRLITKKLMSDKQVSLLSMHILKFDVFNNN